MYTLQRIDNKKITDMSEAKISPSNPIITPDNTLIFRKTTLPDWIKQNTPATIFTPDMKNPV